MKMTLMIFGLCSLLLLPGCRNVLVYVFGNARRHGVLVTEFLDPCSSAALFDGWKERGCKATITDGILSMKATDSPGTAFLCHGMAKLSGPATVNLRVRSQTGGSGKIDSFPNGSADPNGMVSTPFEIKCGDWQEVKIKLNTKALLGTLRLYLPDAESDSIEVAPAKGKAQRWDF